MKARAPLRSEQWTVLILGTALLFGLIVRLFPAWMTSFPMNDGGMFLVMIRDLRANGFRLPTFTSYNLSNIPYAYPPLGFYLAGLAGLSGIPDLELLRWLPILFNLGSCLTFFLLAKAILKDAYRAAIAVLIYTLVPDSFAWQIMGGGLTRALGMLMLVLALYQLHQLFETRQRRHAWLSILFCSLAVLSHPEAGLAAASASALFWFFFGRNRTGLLRALGIAAGTILLTAPWWGSVLHAHGLQPFLNVFHSGEYSSNPLRSLAPLLISWDWWSGAFHLLVLCGLVWNLVHRRFFLAAWYILPFLVEPRSALAYAYLPSVLMAVEALTEVLPALYARAQRVPLPNFLEIKGAQVLLFLLAFAWLVQGSLMGFSIRNSSLMPPFSQQAMEWAAEHTPSGSRFILLTGNGDSMTDPVQEWFPALSGRNSRTTLQGQEWMLGQEFVPRARELAALQACEETRCLDEWSARTGLTYSYVLVERNQKTAALLNKLLVSAYYSLQYENDKYLIFKRY